MKRITLQQTTRIIISMLLMTNFFCTMKLQAASRTGKTSSAAIITQEQVETIKIIKQQLPNIRNKIESMPKGKVILHAKLNQLTMAIEEFKPTKESWLNIVKLWNELKPLVLPTVPPKEARTVESQIPTETPVPQAEILPVEIRKIIPEGPEKHSALVQEQELLPEQKEILRKQAKQEFFEKIKAILEQAKKFDIKPEESQAASEHVRDQIISTIYDLLRNPLLFDRDNIMSILHHLMGQYKLSNNAKIMILFAFDGVRDQLKIGSAWLEQSLDELNPKIKTLVEGIKKHYKLTKKHGGNVIQIPRISTFSMLYPTLRKIINDPDFEITDKVSTLSSLIQSDDPLYQESSIQQWLQEEVKRLSKSLREPAPQSIDMVALFSTGYDNGAITSPLVGAIQQDVLVIVSAPLAYYLYHPDRLKFPPTISPQVNAIFIRNCQEARSKLTGDNPWQIYTNKTKDFFIFVPHKYQGSIQNLGFSNELKRVEDRTVAAIKLKHTESINLKNFKSLFDLSSPINKLIYFAGHGGGLPAFTESTIAELTIDQFCDFLQILETIHTQFLVITSCYAGGLNSTTLQTSLQEELDDEFETAEIWAESGKNYPIKSISFPIVIASTTDKPSAMSQSKAYIKDFFSELNRAPELRKRTFKSRPVAATAEHIPEQNIQHSTFATAIEKLFESSQEPLLAIPSIRYPGKNSSFKAVSLKNLFAITNNSIRRKRLEHSAWHTSQLELKLNQNRERRISHKREISRSIGVEPESRQATKKLLQQPERRKPLAEIFEYSSAHTMPFIELPGGIGFDPRHISQDSEGIKYVFMYPADLSGVEIRIKENFIDIPGRKKYLGIPMFISKIAGNAQHFIERVNVTQTGRNLQSAINQLFFRDPSDMNKAWFIKNITTADSTTDKIILAKIPTSTDTDNPKLALMLYKTANNKFLAVLGSEDFDPVRINPGIIYQDLSEQEFISLCNFVYAKTVPTQEAITQSSTKYERELWGTETVEDIQKYYIKFMHSMGLNIDPTQLTPEAIEKGKLIFTRLADDLYTPTSKNRISDDLQTTIQQF